MFWVILIIVAVVGFFYLKSKANHNMNAYQINGDGSYEFEIVGESNYQDNIQAIAGSKSKESKEYQCVAIIRREPNNAYDKNAVAVFIDNKLVGYFDRHRAKMFHETLHALRFGKTEFFVVNALIIGGWKDGRSEGSFGVILDLPLDFKQWNFEKPQK